MFALLGRFGLVLGGCLLCVSPLGAEEAGKSEAERAEADAVWLIDVILWDAVRNPIAVRRSRSPDPRMQPSLERLERYLESSKKALMETARTAAAEEDEAGARSRVEAVKRLSVLAGMTDDRELRKLVIGLLRDDASDVREAAALGVLQFEDRADSAVDGLLSLLEEWGTHQQALLTLTRVDPRGRKSYRAILRMIPEKRISPAPWINALAKFRWDEKTPAAQRREVLRFLDDLASDPRASGSSTARKVASDIRGRPRDSERR